MKIPFFCAVCGKFLGTYDGKLFYVIPATSSTHVVCPKCEKEPPYNEKWIKDTDTKRNQTILAISEPEKRLRVEA